MGVYYTVGHTLKEDIPCYLCPIFPKCFNSVQGNISHYYTHIIPCKLISKYIGAIKITETGFSYPSEKEKEVEAISDLFIDDVPHTYLQHEKDRLFS